MNVYIVDYMLVDTLDRVRKRVHLGVFKTPDLLPSIKKKIERDNPDHKVVFETYSHKHIFVN